MLAESKRVTTHIQIQHIFKKILCLCTFSLVNYHLGFWTFWLAVIKAQLINDSCIPTVHPGSLSWHTGTLNGIAPSLIPPALFYQTVTSENVCCEKCAYTLDH